MPNLKEGYVFKGDELYKEKLYSLKHLHTPPIAKMIASWIFGIGLMGFVVLFMPWQQNIMAEGELTALRPSERPQTVEAVIAGRIKQWFVMEGQYVMKNDTIAIISEIKEKYFDPELLKRLEEQIKAKQENIESKEAKVEALVRQIQAMKTGLEFKLAQNRQKIIQKQLKVTSDSNDWVAAQVDYQIAKRQMQGYQTMYDSGLISLVKLESVRSKLQQSEAKLIAAENKYWASRNDLNIEIIGINTLEMETLEKITKAESEREATLADIADSQGSLAKLKNEYANMKIRNQQYAILAPQDGFVVNALKQGIGETVKEGEPIVTIMPDNPQKAVALYVKAMDVPLISVGRHVRLQFDGWPALQFTGWPSVSVGTFGGKVQVIDYVNSKNGKYRILVVPDKNSYDEDWPKELRIGSGVFGWVMLDDVPVWFEIWRQLNGFPPSLQAYQKGGAPLKIGNRTKKEEEAEQEIK
ncbi:MAG: HlyD family secretion protein [Cytophagales bacterium]|nr:HlyD family secretion protein [Cytophagales bacterium]MDW8383343.1 HlyD family efflux transporter periplasmic adaptor subunit [Flammeovirgaceae bacterium]